MIRKKTMINRILYAILVWCVFSFKIVLVSMGGSGIRVDDLLVFFAFVLLLIGGDLWQVKRSRPFNIYLAFVGVNLVSAFWNSVQGRIGAPVALLFVARMLQYMIFYYIGYRIARSGRSITSMLKYYLAALTIAVPLQMLGILPVAGDFSGITSRAVGNTNGPYELAAVAAFLLCYLGYQEKKHISGFFAMLLVVLSASRVTSVAAALSVIKIIITRSRRARILGFAVLAAAAVVAGVLVTRPSEDASPQSQVGLVGRLSSVTSGVSFDSLSAAYGLAPVYRNSPDYLDGAFQSAGEDALASEGDTSGLVRLFRWTTLIKSTLSGADSILVGLGPSFGSSAVDGYFVRVFIETGVIGLFIFCWFARVILFQQVKSSWPLREYVFIMLATACFIDIFVSYKPMMLLWLWHGMHQYSGRNLNAQTATRESLHPLSVPPSNSPPSREIATSSEGKVNPLSCDEHSQKMTDRFERPTAIQFETL